MTVANHIEKDFIKILRVAFTFTFGEPKSMSKVEFIRREGDLVYWRVFAACKAKKAGQATKLGKSHVVCMDLGAFIQAKHCLVNVNDEE